MYLASSVRGIVPATEEIWVLPLRSWPQPQRVSTTTSITGNLYAKLIAGVISERNSCFIWLQFPLAAGYLPSAVQGSLARGCPEELALGNVVVNMQRVGTHAECM